MKIRNFAACTMLTAALAMPVSLFAQEPHEQAKADVHAHDAKHHTKAKYVGGGAAGGAVIGAVAGGPTGALVGGAAGAGAGVIANKVHKHHAIKKAEKTGVAPQ